LILYQNFNDQFLNYWLKIIIQALTNAIHYTQYLVHTNSFFSLQMEFINEFWTFQIDNLIYAFIRFFVNVSKGKECLSKLSL
jgi:hypothetical protein